MSRKLLPIVGHLPKKRTSAEDNDDEQTNEDSDALFLKEDNAKRAKLASLSDTTLQDLPNELLECILVKAVVMEVMDLRLIKSVWKDKADLDFSRLKPVSSHWTTIFTTDSFRYKLHRTLDGTAEEKIRLETLHEYSTQSFGPDCVTSLKDEIFAVEQPDGEVYVISVYKRDNLAKVTATIPLEAEPECMAACHVSNCVYVGLPNGDNTLSVKRISKDGDDQFNISPWTMNDPEMSVCEIYVPSNGNLLIRPQQTGRGRSVVRIYDANGCLKREFLEIDVDGNVVRRCERELLSGLVNFADIHGRIVITDEKDGNMELLDPEFNLIGFYRFQQDEGKDAAVFHVHFTSERNEIVRTLFYWSDTGADEKEMVNIFRFTEE